MKMGIADKESGDSPRHSPGILDLGTEGSAGWLILILEGGTITMPLWGLLKEMCYLERGQRGPPSTIQGYPNRTPSATQGLPNFTLQL